MVQNTYGTKWFLVMVRNCNFVVRNGYGAKYIWYEMVSGQFRTITRNHFVPYVFCTINISYHTLFAQYPIWKYNYTMTISYHMEVDTLWPFRWLWSLLIFKHPSIYNWGDKLNHNKYRHELVIVLFYFYMVQITVELQRRHPLPVIFAYELYS
jgi:hypothetical protein